MERYLIFTIIIVGLLLGVLAAFGVVNASTGTMLSFLFLVVGVFLMCAFCG